MNSSEPQELTQEERWTLLCDKADRLPKEPGVYLMRNERHEIIYVGKARELRSRVRSYFSPSTTDTRAFVERLEELLFDFEVILTRTEKEALLLENELIKKHRPRFNVLLKDDKNFLLLKIDPKAEYPWIQATRRRDDDAARYFGPFPSSSAIRETLRVINRHFLLRTCTDQVLYQRKRVCLQYHIRRCLGPCVYDIDKPLYKAQVDDVLLFLEGKGGELVGRLKGKMVEAAKAQRFEVAAHYRDQIRDIETSLERQRVVLPSGASYDAVGLYREGILLEIHVLSFRDGKLSTSRAFPLEDREAPTAEVLSSFLAQLYAPATEFPDAVLLPDDIPEGDAEALAEWLSERRGRKVEILSPKRGEKRDLVDLARKNARAAFEERAAVSDARGRLLDRVARRLGLPRAPERIECYDISTFHGAYSVGSMVVFTGGKPDKGQYRRFKIKMPHQKHDDFAMMYEVLARRFRRAAQGDETFARAQPDLLVIDGGKGQLQMAVEVIKDLKVTDVSVVSLAKERIIGHKDGEPERVIDRVYLPGQKNPIPVRSESSELFLLSRCRDEAHRTAIEFHRQLRQKGTLRSALDDIPGVGEKRRTLLLRRFGSVSGVGRASAEEIAECLGVGLDFAQELLSHVRDF